TASYTVSSTDLNGSVSVTTPNAILIMPGVSTYPHDGLIRVTGANNSRADISIHSSTPTDPSAVQVEIDANGDSVFETTRLFSWNDLEGI
ncbi:MAG TPA: hypothetical protein VFR57_03630, partial [Burkholderiales bacterium]|nr:hypothetical protein [Burkholderiales bacterium]